jgi:hypothetical protein
MVSLFDYLGKAAGAELGKHVADFAITKKAKIETREVSNPRYTGKVMLYERTLLDEFFKLNPQMVIGYRN